MFLSQAVETRPPEPAKLCERLETIGWSGARAVRSGFEPPALAPRTNFDGAYLRPPWSWSLAVWCASTGCLGRPGNDGAPVVEAGFEPQAPASC